MNNAMRNYRLAHVDQVTDIFMQQMRGFGYRIEYVRDSRTYVNRVVSDVLAELGGKNNLILNFIFLINFIIFKQVNQTHASTA
jgi:hypothetical protein